MGLTTQTWYDDRIPIAADDYRHQAAPNTSAIIPHAVASPNPSLMTEYVCRIRDKPPDRAVDTLVPYLRPNRQRQAWILCPSLIATRSPDSLGFYTTPTGDSDIEPPAVVVPV